MVNGYGLLESPSQSQQSKTRLTLQISSMITSYAPFASATSNLSIPLPDTPTAYGYNTLLLDSQSTAMLDMPTSEYTAKIQEKLQGNDFWTLEATVNATGTRYNTTFDELKKNTEFWEDTISGPGYLYSTLSGDEFSQEYLEGNATLHDGLYCLAGLFTGPRSWIDYNSNITSPDFVSFQSTAMMFNIRRERCSGTWQVNRTAINLLGGMCTGELTDQFILTDRNVRPFWFGALPVWSTPLLTTFTINSEDLLSAWLIPAFTAGIGGGNWARIAEQRFNVMAYWGARVTNELLYPPSDKTITATTATLKVTWPLYLLLAVQPLLALAMLITSTVLYTTPIAKGFGLVSVLSGVDKESLSLISGAGLSGESGRQCLRCLSFMKAMVKGNSFDVCSTVLARMLGHPKVW